MDLPFIGIANAWSDIVPGHIHLRTLAQKVREGITAAGGPIGFVMEGDSIRIDLFTDTVDLLFSPEMMQKRRKDIVPHNKTVTGVLARYAALVGQVDQGAVLRNG